MKPLSMTLAAVLCCSVLFIACQKDLPTPSTTDPLPSPEAFAAGKDATVDPGDSFFDYCNGAWLQKQDPHPAQTIGGMYDGETAMEQRIEQLKASVPDIGHFYELMDNIYTQPEKELAFIEAKKASLKKPESKEEAFRAIGTMMAEGVPFSSMSLSLLWQEGKWAGVLVPPASALQANAEGNYDLIPLLATKAASPAQYIIEGMGMDPAVFQSQPVLDPYWEAFWNKSLDELYEMMLSALDFLRIFVAEIPQLTKGYVVSQARTSLSYTISYHFVQQFVPQSLKDKYLGITKEVQASLRKRIENVDWMSETTRQNALDKLDSYGLFVGYPDKWFDDCVASYDGCETLSDAFCRGNRGILRLRGHLIGGTDVFSYYMTQAFKNSSNELQTTDLTLVNAMYSPEQNCVLIYPAILLPPIMPDEGVSEAFHYATFVSIGHEFTHGFDSNGSRYDKYGQKHNWWTVADQMSFDDRKQNIIRCYSTMLLDEARNPTAFGDGDRTQTENIADLGGFLTVLDAYKEHLKAEGFSGDNYKDQLRKFYEAYAYNWRVQYNDAKFDILINSDVHSHARLRVNGVVMNTDDWYDLYGVNRNHILYLPKDRRTYIW